MRKKKIRKESSTESTSTKGDFTYLCNMERTQKQMSPAMLRLSLKQMASDGTVRRVY